MPHQVTFLRHCRKSAGTRKNIPTDALPEVYLGENFILVMPLQDAVHRLVGRTSCNLTCKILYEKPIGHLNHA